MTDYGPSTPSGPEEASWFRRIKRSKVGLSVAALVVIITATAGLTDAVDKIAVWTHLKPDALQVSEAGEREKFSRELIRLIWERLYWSRKMLELYSANARPSEMDKEWEHYQAVVDRWNRDLMVNIMSLQQYYGSVKRSSFEDDIQPKFKEINRCVAIILGRSAMGQGSCALDHATFLQLSDYIDEFNTNLYCFASGLPDKNKKETKCLKEAPTGGSVK